MWASDSARLDCAEVEERQLAEDYARGALDEAGRDAFEEHLFECAGCLERVEALRLIRRALSTAPATVPVRTAASPRRWIWLGAAASLAAVAIVATRTPRAPQPPAPSPVVPSPPAARPDLAELGRFLPPPYEPVALRGFAGASEARFAEAMRRYAAQDCEGALPGLEEAARLDAGAPAPPFFLGICQLLTRRVPEGVASLRRVIAIGDTPYLEPARFYLARGHLLQDDALSALAQLEGTILLRGDLESEARSLAEQVRRRVESPAAPR